MFSNTNAINYITSLARDGDKIIIILRIRIYCREICVHGRQKIALRIRNEDDIYDTNNDYYF